MTPFEALYGCSQLLTTSFVLQDEVALANARMQDGLFSSIPVQEKYQNQGVADMQSFMKINWSYYMGLSMAT